MATPKPAIVIVPGAWQLASSYAPFATQLQEAGFAAEVIAYPSVGGTQSPLPGLAEDVVETRKVLTKFADEGKETVVLCHSYGGVVGSCATEGHTVAERAQEGKRGGVRLVVYMAAFMIPKGKSLMDMLGGQPLPWMDVQVREAGARYQPSPSRSWSVGAEELADAGRTGRESRDRQGRGHAPGRVQRHVDREGHAFLATGVAQLGQCVHGPVDLRALGERGQVCVYLLHRGSCALLPHPAGHGGSDGARACDLDVEGWPLPLCEHPGAGG